MCGNILHVSGQIGLVPGINKYKLYSWTNGEPLALSGSMSLVDGAEAEAFLALRHAERVMEAMHSQVRYSADHADVRCKPFAIFSTALT